MGALGAEVESEEAVLDPRLDDAAPASLPTADCRLPTVGSELRARRSLLRRLVERVIDSTPNHRGAP
jgi:hypothetical protein